MATTDYDMAVQGPPVKIIGMCRDETVACTTLVATTARILREGLPFGSIQVPTGSSITTVTWYGSNIASEGGGSAKDEDGAPIAVQTVAATEIHNLPSSVCGYKFILPVTNVAGSLYLHLER